MLDGPSAPDIATGFAPPVEVKAPQNFTSLRGKDFYENRINPPVYERSTVTEPPRFEDPTTSNPKIDELMANILAQGKPKNTQETVAEVEKNIPAEAKKQGFFAKIWESIKKLFSPWNWSKKDVDRFVNDFEHKLR